MSYVHLKIIHILASTLFFGAGLASAFMKIQADRSGDLRTVVFVHRHLVLADWCFTVPSGLVLPLTGLLMIHQAGIPLWTPWIATGLTLFALAGITWLPAAFLQVKMRDAAVEALENHQPLPPSHRRRTMIWLILGLPSFLAAVGTFYVMVTKTVPFWP